MNSFKEMHYIDAQKIKCPACEAGLPKVYHIQSKQVMHQTPGLGLASCRKLAETIYKVVK